MRNLREKSESVTLLVQILARISFRAPANCVQIIGINFPAQRPRSYFLGLQTKAKKFLKINTTFYLKTNA